MNREEALRWIKTNFTKLKEEGKLAEAMNRYFQTYALKDERIDIEEPVKEEALKIFDGEVNP